MFAHLEFITRPEMTALFARPVPSGPSTSSAFFGRVRSGRGSNCGYNPGRLKTPGAKEVVAKCSLTTTATTFQNGR
jgi:hypothetical protein